MQGLNTQQGVTFLFEPRPPRLLARAKRIVSIQDGRLADDKAK